MKTVARRFFALGPKIALAKDIERTLIKKDTLNSIIPSCFKAPYYRGSLRLKLALSREFKAKSSHR